MEPRAQFDWGDDSTNLPKKVDSGLEDLDHDDWEDDELDGELVCLVADLGGAVDLHQVVLVHQVLQNEVEQPWDILQLVPAV